MRAHFPGAVREVRSAARFRLGLVDVWRRLPSQFFSLILKEDKHYG
jgi:hypothetical protein